MAQSRSDFGLASLIFVAPFPSMEDGSEYWLGPGVSAARSIRISVDVFGLAVLNLPPDICSFLFGLWYMFGPGVCFAR